MERARSRVRPRAAPGQCPGMAGPRPGSAKGNAQVAPRQRLARCAHAGPRVSSARPGIVSARPGRGADAAPPVRGRRIRMYSCACAAERQLSSVKLSSAESSFAQLSLIQSERVQVIPDQPSWLQPNNHCGEPRRHHSPCKQTTNAVGGQNIASCVESIRSERQAEPRTSEL